MASHHNASNPRPLNAKDLTKSPLPAIIRNGEKTHRSSVNPQIFVGIMAKWDSFEKEVRQNFLGQQWENASDRLSWDSDPINSDRVSCATEAGVTGRFMQHVGQTMSCVGHELNLPLWFGDWKGPAQGTPDVTIWQENNPEESKPRPSARIAGEMKAPWTCSLGGLMSRSDSNSRDSIAAFEGELSVWAGQVANYMKTYSYKYGFLSTYNDTVFFKQETHLFNGSWATANKIRDATEVTVLYYSNAVHFDTEYWSEDPRNLGMFRDKVTVRECMLYLMAQVMHDSECNPCPRTSGPWTKEKINGGKKGLSRHLVPKPPKEKNHPDSTASQQSSSKGKAPQQSSYTTGNSLAQKMNGLSMEDPKAAKERYMKYKSAKVHWDKGSKTYTWRKGGERGEVDKHATRHGILLVTIRGQNYRGIEVPD